MQLRTATRFFVAGLALASVATLGLAQVQAPPAPQAPPAAAVPAAPENANPFPPPDPKDFDASSPTKEDVNAFLHASWGYNPNRIWQVQAILKTRAAGVSRVVVLFADKGQPKEQINPLSFFTLPDGKHIIAGDVLPFGPKPFEEDREVLSHADGPSKGPASSGLTIVEFADFECPHCKEAQATIAKLLADYPQARFVFENRPIPQIHSESLKAAAYGVCVAKESGNDTFFKFADAVFDAQDGLTPASSDATLKAAVTKAGGNADQAGTCAASQAAKDEVNAQLEFAEKLGVNSTPTLYVNGRGMPIGQAPYETLQSIIEFQAAEDGISLPPRPPAAPKAPSLEPCCGPAPAPPSH
ncbi:MAG TPA: thioredoxin domain-containing protein [Acidobacteriaceae bacterium]|jgi:protein-disulfide isomerase|nr:thioredoxin domain-containing protein [Acidobacteriaceae bacterium]